MFSWHGRAPIFSANCLLIYAWIASMTAVPVSPTDFARPRILVESKGTWAHCSNAVLQSVDELRRRHHAVCTFLLTPDLTCKQASHRRGCCKRDRAHRGFSNCRTNQFLPLMAERSCETHKDENKAAGNMANPFSLDQTLADLLDGGNTPFQAANASPLLSRREPFSYRWQKPNIAKSSEQSERLPFVMPISNPFQSNDLSSLIPPSTTEFKVDSNPAMSTSSTVSMSKLSEELEALRAEHRDINEISDQLAAKGQYGGGIQFQLVAVKKRKLYLRDRIRSLELKLETLLKESILKAEANTSEESTDPVGTVLSEMMRRLRDLGLKPEQVPPHKDSFFLSLMKSLQRAGLRPNGYDFREGVVLGADRQFPAAAKRARFDVLKLLSSQADKLNGIGGWKLSSEEFQRYFSKSWWTLPAARDDLFMASAHLYSVRIVVFSIEPDRLDEQVYDPPAAPPRATLYLCRRDAHVISTAPLAKAAVQISAPPDVRQDDKISAPDVRQKVPSLEPLVEETKRIARKSVPDVAKEDLDAGLGLLDQVLESDDNFQVEEDLSVSGEIFEDDEVVEDRASEQRRAGSMYGAAVRTRRVFVAVTLEPEARAAVAELAAGLRRDFPLDARLLERAVRWVDPEAYHVTLDALDVDPTRVPALVAAVGRAVDAAQEGPFVVRTGGLGTFWRSAGSGWGRVPRVVWLGLDGAGAGPLLRLREAVDAACGEVASGSGQGFCAHITLGKMRSRGGDGLGAAERRALRALGKWVQDPDRPLALQQLLSGAAAGGAADGAGGGGGRGGKRARSWLRQLDVAALSGRQKQAMTKQLRKSGRDLGALNAQLASDFSGEPLSPQASSMAAGPAPAADGAGMDMGRRVSVEIAVEAVSVIEAVPVAGTGRVRYTVLERFELGRPGAGPG